MGLIWPVTAGWVDDAGTRRVLHASVTVVYPSPPARLCSSKRTSSQPPPSLEKANYTTHTWLAVESSLIQVELAQSFCCPPTRDTTKHSYRPTSSCPTLSVICPWGRLCMLSTTTSFSIETSISLVDWRCFCESTTPRSDLTVDYMKLMTVTQSRSCRGLKLPCPDALHTYTPD